MGATKSNKSYKTHKRRSNSRQRKARKKQNKLLRFLRRTPWWLLLSAGIGLTTLYVYVLYYIFVGPFSLRWKAQFGTVPEPEGYEIRGIDISHYQKKIDWAVLQEAKVSGYPLRFIIIKATEGLTIKDHNFKSNIHQARRRNIITGAYHFYIPGSDALRQAKYFIQNTELGRGDLPPILDVEKTGDLNDNDLTNDILIWLNEVESHYGIKPIIYASYDFKKKHLNSPKLKDYPFWIARYYKDKLEYDGDWLMWQYTDIGEVSGINGKVDCNIFNGTLHELRQSCMK